MNKTLFPYRASEQRFTARLTATDQRRRQLIQNLKTHADELEHIAP